MRRNDGCKLLALAYISLAAAAVLDAESLENVPSIGHLRWTG